MSHVFSFRMKQSAWLMYRKTSKKVNVLGCFVSFEDKSRRSGGRPRSEKR